MTDRRRFLAWLAASGGIAALAQSPRAVAQGRGMAAVPSAPPAPPLRLPDVDDREVALDGFLGRVVLVNFWATWCPPCRKEFPSLGRARKLFGPAGFEVLAVNVGEDPEAVFSFAGTTDFPVLFDRDSRAMAAWSVRGLPTTFLVDRTGRLAYRATGGREFDHPDVIDIVKRLLGS